MLGKERRKQAIPMAVDFSRQEAQPFYHKGDGHGVLLCHGFTGSAAHMRLLAEHLAEQGFTVKTINLPGHATTEMDMERTGWQEWLMAVKNEIVALRKECDQVSMVGLSMGGVLSLLAAEQMELTAAVPISAPMAVSNPLMPFAGLAAPFMPRFAWRDGEAIKKQLDKRYDLGYSGFPTRKAVDLSKLIRMARQDLSAIVCPVLAVQSHADATIAPESAEVIMAGVSSRVKETLWLDGVPHVCTISEEHQRIGQAVGQFLREAEKS